MDYAKILDRTTVSGLERKHYRYLSRFAKNVTEYIDFRDDKTGGILYNIVDVAQMRYFPRPQMQTAEGVTLLLGQIRAVSRAVYPQGGKSGLIVGYCTNVYMLALVLDKYKDILDKYNIPCESYRRTDTEYIYIKLGNTYFLQTDLADVEAIISRHKSKIDEIERHGVLGLTTAAEIRNRIHAAYIKSAWAKNDKIRTLYCDNVEIYKYIMHTIYRGGYAYAKKGEYVDVDMWDMDSAHIRQMLTQRYPTSGFEKVLVTSLDQVREYIRRGYAVISVIEFEDICAKVPGMGVESKATKEGVTLIDSSRHVLKCDKMTATLSEVDLDIYDMIYKWKAAHVKFCAIAKKNPLPAYLRNTVLELYTQKAELKAQGKEYTAEKERANMTYGACATKFDCTSIDDTSNDIDAYRKHVSMSELSPFWAVWTAAYTRREQCRMLSKTAYLAIYGDTDSVYTNSSLEALNAFKTENRRIQSENIKLGVPERLGTWDLKHARKLKVIGAKQYAYISDEGKAVIKSAGIARTALAKVSYDEYDTGLTVKSARRHIEHIDGRYQYVYDDVAIGEAIKLDELDYFIKRLVNRY